MDPWTAEEDKKFIHFVGKHGCANWRDVPILAGLERSWTSCRSRWMKFLRYNSEGVTIAQNENTILYLRIIFGDDWSEIASFLQGITGDEIECLWNTCLKKKFTTMNISLKKRLTIMKACRNEMLSKRRIDPEIHLFLRRMRSIYLTQKLIQRGIDPIFSQGRIDNNDINNFNSIVEEKGVLSPPLIQGDSQKLDHLPTSVSKSNLIIDGKSIYSAKNRHPFDGPREDGLKEIDNLHLWMSTELGDIKESNRLCSSGVFREIGESENEVHDSGIVVQACLDSHMLSPCLSESQLYSIIDFLPNWAYVSSKVEVQIRGSFLRSHQEAKNCQWSCMFGEVEVPAEIVLYGSGVLRCHTISQKVGWVPFYVTCSNRLACSEVREFEYRANLIQDAVATDDYGDVTSESLGMRFGELLRLSAIDTPNCDPSNLTIDLSQLKHKVSSLLKVESDGRDTSEEKFSSEEVKVKLLQKQLKEKLQAWLLQKAAEGGNGPSVLDQHGQGVLHFAAALGYDWAIEPTIVAGVDINFRDVNGWTALDWAIYYGRKHTDALLRSLGAAPGALSDPTPKYPSGQTPADLASSIGHGGIAPYLVESDINLNKQDSDVAEIHGAKVFQTGYLQCPTPMINDDVLIIQQQNVKIQGVTSSHSVDVASESLMDYTNEFANYKVFKSKDALMECTREIGRKNGFEIVTKRSDSGKSGPGARVTLCCERGGKYRNATIIKENNKEKQVTNTKKCNCPFTLQGRKVDSNDNWILKVVCGVHNHPLTIKPPKGRSRAGSLSKKQTKVVEILSKEHLRPREIRMRIQGIPSNDGVKIKSIYNCRQRQKGKEKAESSKTHLSQMPE